MLKYSRIHLQHNLVEWTDNLELVEGYTSAEIRQCLKGETAIVQGKRATLLHKRRSLQECGDQDNSDHYLSQTLQQSDSKGENGDTTRVFKMTFGARSVDPQKLSSSGYHRSRKKHEHSLKLLRCSISHYFCVKHHFYCVPFAQTQPEKVKAPTDGYQADESDTNDACLKACGDTTEDSEMHRGYMELLIRKLYENPSKFGSLKSQKIKVKTCAGGKNGGDNPPDRQESNRRPRQKTRKEAMRELAALGGNGMDGSESPSPSSGEKGPADKLQFRPPEEEQKDEETSTESETKSNASKRPKRKNKSIPRLSSGKVRYRSLSVDNDDLSRWQWKPRSVEDSPSQTSLTSTGIGSRRKSIAPTMQGLGPRSSVSVLQKWEDKPISPLPTPSSTLLSSVPPPLFPPPEEKRVKIKDPVEVKLRRSVTISKEPSDRSEISISSQGTEGLINHTNKRFPRISKTYQNIINSVTQVEKWRREKDNEWLLLPGHDPDSKKSSVDAWDLVDSTPPQTIEPEVKQFMLCQQWLVMAMTIFGVYPYEHVVTSSKYLRVIWAKHSLNSICLFLSTVTAGIFVVCIYWSMIRNFQVTLQPTEIQSIFYIEFQKYMVEGFEVTLGLIFLTVWGVTVLSEMGRQQAEFMTRLFYSISLLKYTVSDKISDLIKKRVCILGTMIGITGLLVVFGGDVIPTPREACGFIALLIVSPFEDRIRAQNHFRVMEILGYFVFVWVHTSMSLVLLHLVVVARALKNMARNFNLRLAYRLGQISLDKLGSKEANIVREIPFQKLFAERLVISSLIKQMGYTHLVAINLYVCIAGAEMILFLYGNSRYFNSTLMEVNASFDASSYKLPHPLRMGERGSEIIFKNLTYIFHFMYITYLVLNGLNQTGYVFGLGKDYIRKHGLVNCKSSKERRFILSMLTLDNPKLSHFIGVRFPMNRIFIIGMIAVVGFFWAISMAYSPDRLSKQEFTVCDEDGVCSVISLSRGSAVRRPVIYVLLPDRSEKFKLRIRPKLMFGAPPYWFTNETYPYVQSIREGSIPLFHTFHSMTYATSWNGKDYPATVSIPNIFKEHEKNGSVYYELLTRELRNSKGGVVQPLGRFLGENLYVGEKVQNETRNNVSYYTGDVTQQLTGDEWDDCGNPSAPFFVREGDVFQMKPPNITLVATDTLPGGDPLGRELYLCCYEYWREDGTLGESTCNMPRLDVLHANCKETANVKGQHFANILRHWRYESSQSNIDPLDVASVKESFTHCICRERWKKTSPGGEDSLCTPTHIPRPPSKGCKQILDTSMKRIDGTMRLTQPIYSWDLSYGYTFLPYMYRVHHNARQLLYTPYTRDLWHDSSSPKHSYDAKAITNFAKQGVDFATCQNGTMAKVHPKLLDDCGNPPVDSLNNVTNKWNLSPLVLIYKGLWTWGNLNFMCCYNYSNSPVAMANCNVPPGRFGGNCERDDAIPKRYDERLTQYTGNMQARGIPFDLRVNTTVTNVWTMCICRERVTFDEIKQKEADEKCNKLFEDLIP